MQVSVQEDEVLGKAYDARLMRRILKYLSPYKGKVFLALIMIFATGTVELAGPYLTKLAIDTAIVPGKPELLPGILAIFISALAIAFVFRYAQNIVMQIIGQSVMYDIRHQIFSHLQHQSLSYFDRNPVGRLISRLTNDVDALNEFIGTSVVTVVGDVVILLGVVVVMFILDWRLALISLAVLPLIALASWGFQRLMRTTYRQQRVRLARVNTFLQENISGMLVVQLFNRERRQFNEFDKLNSHLLESNIDAMKVFSIFFPIVTFLSTLAVALLIWYGSGGVLEGTVTLGVLVAFFQYTERAFQPIRDLAEKYNIMQAAMAASERVFMLLDEQPAIVDSPSPKTLGVADDGRRTTDDGRQVEISKHLAAGAVVISPSTSQPSSVVHRPSSIEGDIEFRDVHFAYNPEEPVLKGINLKIPAGTSVAIVGATGAGKTSIISLLSRFYDVQQGQILLDGIDVRDVRQQDLRRHIGVVLQDPVLFSGTIARNIRLLDEDISDEEVVRAARFVNAAHFIERFEDGYEHSVKERGANLSVGQRQLLTFARAIAFNPSVLLVMDEATSSVDTETEALIQDALYKMMRGRTSIIIAHRLSTIKHVDRIIVLHKGHVVEDGTHEELMARNGYYYRLYQLQYQEQEALASSAAS
ncbi:MAG TPA: ABC transporter ATP-binding protein [Chloroflexia bacterium]|nr:ABC transporter ATP-binding protein [Chloroflexia bacterium]